MPHDHLQIGLEHHRGGRVRQAEAAYRAVLAQTPDHADALHWLGVLLTQAGEPAAAIPMLRQAVAAREEDAAFQHNLGQALLMTGQVSEAIASLTESAALDPARPETLLALARAYAIRRSPSDANAAVTALRRAREQGIDTPELRHDLGVALLGSGRPDQAINELARAMEMRPDYAPAMFQTAMAHRAREDRKAARNWLNKALETDREYAQAWHALGVVDAEVGNFELAIGHFRRAVMLRPDMTAARRALEAALRRIGRDAEADEAGRALQAMEAAESSTASVVVKLPAEADTKNASPAVAALEDRITMDPARAKLHEALSAISGLLAPERATPAAIAQLFDKYAEQFEHHLRDKLRYAGPEQLTDAVRRAMPDGRLLDIADLGCGTGLCGPLLKPLARSLVGVDLSSGMLERAASRNVYDRLETGDLLDFLKRSPGSFDLLMAADVLIYLGDLTPLFESVERALRPGGLFAASFEAGDAERYERNPRTRRYTHSRDYLEKLGRIFGFKRRSMEQVTLRYEMASPVPAWIAVFEKQ